MCARREPPPERGPYRGGQAGARRAPRQAESAYNNYIDTDAAWRAAHDPSAPSRVAIIRARQPVHRARRRDSPRAHRKAHACDPISAFGGVIATDRRRHRGRGRAVLHSQRRRRPDRKRTCSSAGCPSAPGAGAEWARRACCRPGTRRRAGRRPDRVDPRHGRTVQHRTRRCTWRTVAPCLLAHDQGHRGRGRGSGEPCRRRPAGRLRLGGCLRQPSSFADGLRSIARRGR